MGGCSALPVRPVVENSACGRCVIFDVYLQRIRLFRKVKAFTVYFYLQRISLAREVEEEDDEEEKSLA